MRWRGLALFHNIHIFAILIFDFCAESLSFVFLCIVFVSAFFGLFVAFLCACYCVCLFRHCLCPCFVFCVFTRAPLRSVAPVFCFYHVCVVVCRFFSAWSLVFCFFSHVCVLFVVCLRSCFSRFWLFA